MTFRVHQQDPTDAVEAAYFRIQQERMQDVPILNPALSVAAIDFQRWQGHWLGIVVSPWCMSILLLPGSTENWASPGVNKRRFVKFPAGDFAFLVSVEAEIGEFQSCALFSPMNKFSTQSEATLTARASLVGLLSAPPADEGFLGSEPKFAEPLARPEGAAQRAAAKLVSDPNNPKPALSRRRFFAMR